LAWSSSTPTSMPARSSWRSPHCDRHRPGDRPARRPQRGLTLGPDDATGDPGELDRLLERLA
jgi:hypothetical protein